MLKKLLNIDIIAGLAAGAFAIAGVFLPELSALADPKVAGVFAIAALGRGIAAAKGGE